MPAVSKSQANLMRAAEHGASFPMAQQVRQSMSLRQMHDFAVGSSKGKPVHVKGAPRRKWLGHPHPLRNLRHYGHPKGGY